MKQKPLINRDYKHYKPNAQLSEEPKSFFANFRLNSKYTLLTAGIALGIITVVIANPKPQETITVTEETEEDTENAVFDESSQLITTSLDVNLVSNPLQQSSLPAPIINQPKPKTEPLSIEKNKEPKTEPVKYKTLTVKSGDTLAKLLSRAGLNAQQVHELISTDKNTKKLTRIFPGNVFKAYVDDQGVLQRLTHEINETKKLEVKRENGKLSSRVIELPVDIRYAFAQGTINSSLFLAAQKAGLADKSTMELAGIFGWDIDFALDMRKGDSFSVMYEEIYRDGKKLRNGAIISAEFTNQNKTYQAIRFTTSDGDTSYYAPDGTSMRKTFLRTPVEFSRISSRFSLNRKHPILNKIRSHKGVDYAAPTGTPIRSTGDGKITFRGRKGGYGKTIVIQHGSRYSTLYAHMSRYAKGMRSGQKVKQGKVIGYIGSTGLATGPHLHYEFRVDGVHRNPLTVKFPQAEPLPKKYKAEFKKVTNRLLAQLEAHKKTHVALGEN